MIGFVLVNLDTHLQSVLPVARRLEPQIRSVFFSGCELQHAVTRHDVLAGLGIDYVQLLPVAHARRDRTWDLYNVWLRRHAREMLRAKGITVLVVPNDRTYPFLAFIRAAKQLRIPVVLLQESLRKDELQTYSWLQRAVRSYHDHVLGIGGGNRRLGQGGCDHIAAWGPTSQEYFLRAGVPPGRIHLTGNPRLDRIVNTDWRQAAAESAAALGIPADGSHALFLTSPLVEMGLVEAPGFERLLRDTIAAFGAVRASGAIAPSSRLLIRPHRLERLDTHRAMIAAAGGADYCMLAETGASYPLMALCRASVIISTTAGLEAALFGSAVGMLRAGKPLDAFQFIENGLATGLDAYDDTRAFFDTSLRAPRMTGGANLGVDRYVAHLGTSGQVVSDLVRSLC